MSWLPRSPKKIVRIALLSFISLLFIFIWYLSKQQPQLQLTKNDRQQQKQTNREYYTNLDQTSVMLTIQSTSQFISYYPLLCRFKHYPLHLVLLTRDGLNQQKVQRVFTESACEHADNVILHDLTNILDPLEQLDALFSDIQTKVLLQSDTPVHPTLKALIDKHQITHIALPEKEIIHALWIPDLSIGALQSKQKKGEETRRLTFFRLEQD